MHLPMSIHEYICTYEQIHVYIYIGAGLLNMLPTIHKILKNASKNENMKKINLKYIAFESNESLINQISDMLTKTLEFKELLNTSINSNIKLYNGVLKTEESDVYIDISVHMISEDFMSDMALEILNNLLLNDKDLNSNKQDMPRYEQIYM